MSHFIDNSLRTRKITFRVHAETFARITAAVESEPRLWGSSQTVSGYIQRLINADLKRREEGGAKLTSDNPPAKRRTAAGRRPKVRQK